MRNFGRWSFFTLRFLCKYIVDLQASLRELAVVNIGGQAPEDQTPDDQTPEDQTPEDQTPDVPTPETRPGLRGVLRYSREEPGELAEELLPPAAGEVNHLAAAPDAAADTRPLLLALRTALTHNSRGSEVSVVRAQWLPSQCEPVSPVGMSVGPPA